MCRFASSRVFHGFIGILFLFLVLTGCQKKSAGTDGAGDPGSGPGHSDPKLTLEQEVFQAGNQLRTDPKSFVSDLELLETEYHGKVLRVPHVITLDTEEGVSAVEEALQFLKTAAPVDALSMNPLLTQAALEHVTDQGKTGDTGHYGSDGSSPKDRIEKYGAWNGAIGENISYGRYNGPSGRSVILQLFVDDGVSDRGHRKNLMSPDFDLVGISCGPHPQYRTMCVLDYATRIEPKATAR